MQTVASQPDSAAALASTGGDSLTIEAVGPVEIVPELGWLDGVLATVSLLILFAFLSSLFKWVSLLRSGKRPFGDTPFVPVVHRPRPYWNAIHFVMFYGFVILFSVALTGVAGSLGYVDLDALRAQAAGEAVEIAPTSNESEPEVQSLVVADSVDSEAAAEPESEEPEVAADPASDDLPKAADASAAITVPQLLISSTAMLASTLACLLVLRVRRPEVLHLPGTETYGHERPFFGFAPTRNLIRLGLIGAWLILPPTMLMMGAVSALQEYSHPVLDALEPAEEGGGPNYAIFAALFFTTAIVTPLVEEFWFRGLLQGGLQRIADARTDALRWGFAVPGKSGADADSRIIRPSRAEAIADPATRVDWTPTAIWPMVVASLLFAIMHWGQGLAPIPLFFLSLGLGYLYRQTGSLVPPIVVHFVLNGFTMSATFLEMLK